MYSDEDEEENPMSDMTSEVESRNQDEDQEVDEFGNIGTCRAVEAMEDVEILVEEEDTERITDPIVKPIVTKRFSHHIHGDKHGLPRTKYSIQFLQELMKQDHAIRNIAIIGHLLHGKTSFVDCLVDQTHIDFEQNTEKSIRFTDTTYAEQERGISIKSSPLTIVHQNLRGKSYLLNIMDTPGHVNFSDEVTSALRLCDGVMLVVDAGVGIMMNTERLLKHAVREGMAVTLCINKIDRLILELKLPPNDAYHKIKCLIDQVNVLMEGEGEVLSPLLNNVCFASSQYSLCFTLESFAKLYVERSETKAITYKQLASKLWGDMYLDKETSKFKAKPPVKQAKRSFVEFILEPLYKFFRLAVEEPDGQFLELCQKHHIRISREQKKLNVKSLLRVACSQMFGTSTLR